jgi:hypothetical protein
MRLIIALSLSIIISGCASTTPRYKDVWVNDSYSRDRRALEFDKCNQRAQVAEQNYINARGTRSSVTNEGAMYNFTTTLASSKTRDR